MMTMNSLIQKAGINLSREVGVQIQAETMTGKFTVTDAIVGRILGNLPEAAKAQCSDFDPEHDVAVLWSIGSKDMVIVLSVLHGAEVYANDKNFFVVEHEMYRVIIGQSETFIQEMRDLSKKLS